MSYKSSLKNWEGLAQRDPLWSICTHPSKKNQQWDIETFFSTGREEIDRLTAYLMQEKLMPVDRDRALDFGCGVGRLSQALTPHFDEVHGIDAAPSMIKEADRLKTQDSIHFHVNNDTSLPLFPDDHFSFIFTIIVLQHIPYPQSIEYIASFIQKLKPGGILVFQIPTLDIRRPSLVQRIKSTLKIRERLALIGIGRGFHMNMYPVPDDELTKLIVKNGGTILRNLYTNHTLPDYVGKLEFIDKKNSIDFLSNLYIVTK